MRSLIFVLSLLLGTAFTSSLHAQDAPLDTTKLWRIITTDGNTYFGSILAQDETTLQLKTEVLGVIKLLPENVKAIDPVSETALAEGMLWADNPQAARHFWSPTGYGLKASEGYYQNIWILYNQVSVGFNDYFSMGFGIIPVFLFGELSTPIWITPKLSVPIIEDKLNAGAGLFLGTILGESGSGGFGIAYGVGTLGSRDRNLTLGLGYGFADGEWASRPITTLSGMYRISEKGYVITENFLLPKMGIMSFGGRTVWPNVALDYGGIVPVGVDGRIVIPWLGMTITMR